MFISIDGMSKTLPADVLAMPTIRRDSIDYGGTQGTGTVQIAETSAIGASTLDRWDVQSHQYKTEAQVETSILARLFSGSGKVSNYGLVQEAKRFCVQTTDRDRRVEYGTAVRLSVAVLSSDFNIALTLPNIAAKAQLNDIHARIALSVDGYVGPLGELLPAPDNLNVENLAVYTTAFKAIQALVFGNTGLDYISPTLLGYEDFKSDPQAASDNSTPRQK